MLDILLGLCDELETNNERQIFTNESPQKSMIDPSIQKMRGYKTTSTSAKVNRTSPSPRTKMVDCFQVNALHRAKSPAEKRRKHHRCPICRREGHHARTCHDVLLDENSERSNTFFEQLVREQKVDSYISSLAKRESHASVKNVLRRIETVSLTKTPGTQMQEECAKDDSRK